MSDQLSLFGQLDLFGAPVREPAPHRGDWFSQKCPTCGHRIGLHSGPKATASAPGSCCEAGCTCPGWIYWAEDDDDHTEHDDEISRAPRGHYPMEDH